jgi:hypothetical protein
MQLLGTLCPHTSRKDLRHYLQPELHLAAVSRTDDRDRDIGRFPERPHL